eukprot:4303705-Amphidinium_carterae.1
MDERGSVSLDWRQGCLWSDKWHNDDRCHSRIAHHRPLAVTPWRSFRRLLRTLQVDQASRTGGCPSTGTACFDAVADVFKLQLLWNLMRHL